MNGAEAAGRVEFQLSFCRAARERRFTAEGLSGESIDCAVHDGARSTGNWSQDFPDWEEDRDDWHRWFLRAAVNESIHEALEWYKIDGRPAIDPHSGRIMQQIYTLTDAFVDELWKLRKETQHGPLDQ